MERNDDQGDDPSDDQATPDRPDRVLGFPTNVGFDQLMRAMVIGVYMSAAVAVSGAIWTLTNRWEPMGAHNRLLVKLGLVVALSTLFLYLVGRARHVEVSSELEAVQGAIVDNGTKLGRLDKLDGLDRVQVQLDQQTGVLEDIRDLL